MSPLTIAYTDEYLDWQLGEGHPSDPRRAAIAVAQLAAWAETADVEVRRLVPRLDWAVIEAQAARVHDAAYLQRVRSGVSSEWAGRQKRLGEVAGLMFLGTVDLVEQALTEHDRTRPHVYFNPQGAKHHAHRASGSGSGATADARGLVRGGRGFRDRRGAGGYQPLTETPDAWFRTVTALHQHVAAAR